MRKVIIDTNMLLVPGQFKVDIFTELDRIMDEPYEMVIIQGSLEELKKIAETGSGADKQAAKLANMLIEHQRRRDFSASSQSNCKGLKIVPGSKGKYVDDAIVEIAEDEFVATNDSALKRRLLEKGVRVIYLKQQQHLAISA
jgi:rRNA-processing protein FCF1